ncbi:MAG: FAD:protein FMN transferase [Planctomycetota bacterium]|nr:FAD:protein FMN transferase [Planctomycetota bacterium]
MNLLLNPTHVVPRNRGGRGITLRPMAAVLALTLGTAVSLLMGGCAGRGSPQRFEFTRVVMGVQAQIAVFGEDPVRAEEAAAAAFTRMSDLDAMMSDYRRGSELNRLSDAAGASTPQPISPDLLEVFVVGLEVSEASGGAFDMTIGPAVALWRESRKSGVLPAAAELERVKSLVNWRQLELNAAAGTGRLRVPGMRLDLGGIAKGYAARQGLVVLRAKGHPQAMVALAGDVALGEAPPRTKGWKVAVSGGPHVPPLGVLYLTKTNVSTSGDTQQFVEIEGRRYSHIVDPRTGLGVRTVRAVTVVAEDGAVCDALATAGSMLGAAEFEGVLGRFEGAGAIVQELEKGEVRVIQPRRGAKVKLEPFEGDSKKKAGHGPRLGTKLGSGARER